MGDGGVLYKSVPTEMVELYRTLLFPLANCIKLNQTELEYLADCKITSEEEAWKAMEKLHSFGVEHVVVSSVSYIGEHMIGVLASTRSGPEASFSKWSMEVPKRDEYYTGTGDLFNALLLAWLNKDTSITLGDAVQKVVSSIQHVLDRSNDAANQKLPMKEIRLVQSSSHILNPSHLIPIKAYQ